jgi:antirestriction protein ArdC
MSINKAIVVGNLGRDLRDSGAALRSERREFLNRNHRTGLPRNLVSMKPDRGINYFLLSAWKYVSPYWVTMYQANELGRHVRRGEESTAIVFWKVNDARDDAEDASINECDGKTRKRFLLRYYRVWNVEQCDLPVKVLDKLPKIETRQHDPIDAAERIIAEMPNPQRIAYRGSMAFYSPGTDCITLPPRQLFTTAAELYCTAYHELIHSTGTEKRLAREALCEAAPFVKHRSHLIRYQQ